MKKNFFAPAITMALTVFGATAFAQNNATGYVRPAVPKWVSKMGYWVTESNIHTPKHNIVYFYNNDNVMVYKETMDNVVLNIDKRRTKMRLKKLVDKTVATYVQQQKAAENEMLVMNVMRK